MASQYKLITVSRLGIPDDVDRLAGPASYICLVMCRAGQYVYVTMETNCLVHSFSAQASCCNDLIQMNPEWEFTGVYADEGINGSKNRIYCRKVV